MLLQGLQGMEGNARARRQVVLTQVDLAQVVLTEVVLEEVVLTEVVLEEVVL